MEVFPKWILKRKVADVNIVDKKPALLLTEDKYDTVICTSSLICILKFPGTHQIHRVH